MTLTTSGESRLGRSFVVLAPPQEAGRSFDHMVDDPIRHDHLLAEVQRLRGMVYLADGAIQTSDLSLDGRHVQAVDDVSWHLLTVDSHGSVTAGIRYLAHRPGVTYSDLGISRSIADQTATFKSQVRRAVQSELERAALADFSYVELGGWVVSEELRCSTEAIRMLLMMYALSQSLGGALALSTATARHSSSAMLRRSGGRSMVEGGVEVPSYYDPHYNCEMEVLAFDSRFPNPRYTGWIREFSEALHYIPMISAGPASTTSSLLRLHSEVADCPVLLAQ